MKKIFGIVALAAMPLVWSAEFSNALAQETKSGGKHFGTVERTKSGAHAGTTVKAGGKECVVDLTYPKEKGHCKLGPNDPPAHIKVKGWYFSQELSSLLEPLPSSSLPDDTPAEAAATREAHLYDLDIRADTYIRRYYVVAAATGVLFWDAKEIHLTPAEAELNPPAGENDRWSMEAFTSKELDKAMDIALKWASAWGKYRGYKYLKKPVSINTKPESLPEPVIVNPASTKPSKPYKGPVH